MDLITKDLQLLVYGYLDFISRKNFILINRSYLFLQEKLIEKYYISILNKNIIKLFDIAVNISNISNISLLKYLKNIKKIKFNNNFDNQLETSFPNTITKIKLGDHYTNEFQRFADHNIFNIKNLKYLKFGNNFVMPIDYLNLGENLTILIIKGRFNQNIEKLKLPANLKKLKIKGLFNQPIENMVLPDSLTKLILGPIFSHPITKLKLPVNLKKLDLGRNFGRPNYYSQPTDNFISPPLLQKLYIGGLNNKITINPGLKYLYIRESVTSINSLILPPNLEYLRLDYTSSLDKFLINNKIGLKNLTLVMGKGFNFDMGIDISIIKLLKALIIL